MDDDVEITGFRKTLHFIAEEELGPPGNEAPLDDASVADSSEELFTGEKGMLVREICYLDKEVQALKDQLSDLDDMLLALKAGFRYKNGYLDVPADVWHQVFDAYADPDPKTKAYKQKEVELKQELDSLTAELADLQEESVKLFNNYKKASIIDPKRALLAAGSEKANATLKETRDVLGVIKNIDARLRTTHQKTNEIVLAWDCGYALQSVITELARFLDRAVDISPRSIPPALIQWMYESFSGAQKFFESVEDQSDGELSEQRRWSAMCQFVRQKLHDVHAAMEFLKRLNEEIEQFLGEHSMPFVHNKETLTDFFVDPSVEEMY